MVAQIISIIEKLLGFLGMLASALRKTPSEVIAADKAKIKEEIDKIKAGGRPQ